MHPETGVMMSLSLNKPKLDNLANEIGISAERLRRKFKAYEYQNAEELLAEFWRLEKEAEALLKGLAQ